jgi:uncharacterized protein YdeI (YjbR/CyaY-like superfamily)
LARGALTQIGVHGLFHVEQNMNNDTDTSRMKREIYPMPEDVRAALTKAKALDTYNSRPAYQQNDYVGWITRAKLPATREKRIQQMLDELRSGGVYMKMKWNG